MTKQRATLKDVAEAVGVHTSTVSRALNPQTRHMVSAEIVARVEAASRTLKYQPNTAASSLRTNRTQTVGVVIPDITNPIFPPIIRGLEDALGENNYAAIVVNTDGRPEREAHALRMLAARGIDGLVIASVERDAVLVHELAAGGLPIVTVNRRTDDPSISSVINDEQEGVRQMLTHLIALGHRRIAHLAGQPSLSTGLRRAEAFQTHAAQLGLDAGERRIAIADAYNEASGERAMEELLARDVEITAVLTANDRLAIGAIAALRRRGLSCPIDVSVSGFNDMPMVDRIDPPLTTIRIQQYDVGRTAGDILLTRIGARDKTPAAEHRIMPVQLVARGSTAPLKASRVPPAGRENPSTARVRKPR